MKKLRVGTKVIIIKECIQFSVKFFRGETAYIAGSTQHNEETYYRLQKECGKSSVLYYRRKDKFKVNITEQERLNLKYGHNTK